jgi:hypothetical protein
VTAGGGQRHNFSQKDNGRNVAAGAQAWRPGGSVSAIPAGMSRRPDAAGDSAPAGAFT